MSEQKNIWHSLSCEEVFKKQKTSKKGLSKKEAESRLKTYGPNKLPEKKGATTLGILLSQFKSPLVYILAIAGGLSFALGEATDGTIIAAAVIINTAVGFFEEYKADKSLKEIKKFVSFKAKVIRDGTEKEISSEEIVSGDILVLDAGDKIPADVRLFDVHNFEVAEAALTGESLPIKKNIKELPKNKILAERQNMAYAGTLVLRGRASGIVIHTGEKTEVGKIALMLRELPEEKTPLQESISKLGKQITIFVTSASALIFVLGVLQKKDILEIFITSVAVAVAAIPEGLVIAVTIILILGMGKILKQKALVRKLVAAETLGSVSVICTDKTGTLTEGEMRVADVFCCQKIHSPEKIKKIKCQNCTEILKSGLLCNDAIVQKENDQAIIGDAMDKALLIAGEEAGLNKLELEEKMKRIDEIPFDSSIKYMATLNKLDSKNNILVIKGAPEIILSYASKYKINGKTEALTKEKKKEFEKYLETLAEKGYRVLGFANREVDKKHKKIGNGKSLVKDLVFLGFVTFDDPLRPSTKKAFELTRRAGIRPVMITGDHRTTAVKIAQKLGLSVKDENVITGDELDKMSDDKLREKIKYVNVFARVEPKHKVRIVDAYQANGKVVSMTGDGVNDAPALKSADIGVALGYGTEVAKGASDIILLDNNFQTIVHAVESGRMIFENIKKVVLYLLSSSFAEIILILCSMIFALPLPILPAQILWVNLVEDTFPNIALSFDPGEKEVMNDPPRKKNAHILDKEMKILIFVIGVLTDLVLFGIFYYFWKTTGDLALTRSVVFVGLAIDSLFFVWACRSFRFTIFHKNPLSNKFLIFSTVFGFAMLIVALYIPFFQNLLKTVPLGLFEWGMLVAFGILNIVLIEIVKYVFIIEEKHKKLFK